MPQKLNYQYIRNLRNRERELRNNPTFAKKTCSYLIGEKCTDMILIGKIQLEIIYDSFCSDLQLATEVDGKSHDRNEVKKMT